MPDSMNSSSAAIVRRVMSFSLLGLVALLVALGLFKPTGLAIADQAAVAPSALTGSDVTREHIPALLITGFAAGLLSGLIGMGGGVLKMTFMLLFLRFDMTFARAISVVTMFFSSSAALWGFVRLRLVAWPYALRMAAVAAPSALIAAAIGNNLHESTLTIVFAFFMVFLALNTLAFIIGDPDERMMNADVASAPQGSQRKLACGIIGGLHGATCGLLGISGGVIATPLQQLSLSVPLRYAIGNTLLVSTAVTLIAGICVLSNGVQRGTLVLTDVLFVDLFIGGGAMIGAPIGTYLGQRCNVTLLRLLFVGLTLGAGMSILT